MTTRRLFALALAAASAALAAPAFAAGSLVNVEIVDRGRQELLPNYVARGATWVAGQPGSRYAIRLTNHSGGRVLVVLSVDGVNAVSGETAALGQTGYVLAPYQTTEITGWRKSLTEAAAFYFTALPDSYAARTDRPDNVGVIGAAVFREREDVAMRRRLDEPRVAQGQAAERESAGESRAAPAAPGAQAAPSPSAKSMARDDRLGTGHGEREYAPTSHTSFERASERPAEIVRIRYDSYRNLLAGGIVPRPRPLPPQPEAFPGFVPDPKG